MDTIQCECRGRLADHRTIHIGPGLQGDVAVVSLHINGFD